MNISFRALDLASKLSNSLPRKISTCTQVMFFSMYVRDTYYFSVLCTLHILCLWVGVYDLFPLLRVFQYSTYMLYETQ